MMGFVVFDKHIFEKPRHSRHRRLTDRAAREIRCSHASYHVLALRYGVSKTVIAKLWRGETYRWPLEA